MAHLQVEDGGNALHIWRVAVIISNMQSCMTDRGCSFSMGVGQGPETPHCKKKSPCYGMLHTGPQILWNIRTGKKRLFEYVAELKYLGMRVTN
jgi:hypothetical protein